MLLLHMISYLISKKIWLVGFKIVFEGVSLKRIFSSHKKKESGPPRGPKTDFKTH